jgi:hypothetical protein
MYEKGQLTEPMKAACHLKFRDIISETVNEYQNKGEFVRIYPARNSKMYDRFFSSGKNGLNKILYKVLFTSEVLPYPNQKDQLPPQCESGLTKQNSS